MVAHGVQGRVWFDCVDMDGHYFVGGRCHRDAHIYHALGGQMARLLTGRRSWNSLIETRGNMINPPDFC